MDFSMPSLISKKLLTADKNDLPDKDDVDGGSYFDDIRVISGENRSKTSFSFGR